MKTYRVTLTYLTQARQRFQAVGEQQAESEREAMQAARDYARGCLMSRRILYARAKEIRTA